jgi:hypothetical protein
VPENAAFPETAQFVANSARLFAKLPAVLCDWNLEESVNLKAAFHNKSPQVDHKDRCRFLVEVIHRLIFTEAALTQVFIHQEKFKSRPLGEGR